MIAGMSLIFSFASTRAALTSEMYFVRFSVRTSLMIAVSCWAVNCFSFFTKAVFFFTLESYLKKYSSDGWVTFKFCCRKVAFCA
uniref:Uncharacterized protein n=1 Tax=Anopheles darlingi TaxID=43151 RepID=A0A2M4D567_ANODA